jgi:hypothetical protein
MHAAGLYRRSLTSSSYWSYHIQRRLTLPKTLDQWYLNLRWKRKEPAGMRPCSQSPTYAVSCALACKYLTQQSFLATLSTRAGSTPWYTSVSTPKLISFRHQQNSGHDTSYSKNNRESCLWRSSKLHSILWCPTLSCASAAGVFTPQLKWINLMVFI